MHTEASIAPENGHATQTPSPTTHWLEEHLPPDVTWTQQGTTTPLRDHPTLQKYASVEDMAKALVHSQQMIGKKNIGLTELAEDATEQDKAAFDAELRRLLHVPEGPDDYDIALPDGLSEEGSLLGWFKGVAHELGISQQQAQTLSDRYNELMQDLHTDSGNRLADQEARCMASLRKLWGTQATQYAETARRGFQQTAARAGIDRKESDDILQAYGFNPVMLRIFYEVGRNQIEDDFVPGSSGPQSTGQAMTMQQFFAEKVFGRNKE